MIACDQFREQIWDELFGLLEAGDSRALHLHLESCRACQAEMVTARAEHQLVAEAARLEVEIPFFSVPEADEEQPSPRTRRPRTESGKRPFRILPWLATAAAVLALLGLPLGLYEVGRLRYQAVLQAAEADLTQVAVQRKALEVQGTLERENLVRTVQAKHLRLQVIGPAAYQLAAANPYRVQVTDIAGNAVDAPVTARLLDPETVLEAKKAENGEWVVEIPPNLPLATGATPLLELAVRDQAQAAPVRTPLRVLEPAYRTHLVTDKPVYHVGDTIYFRSLTLERFGLKVPKDEFTVTYTLANAQGEEFQTLGGLTKAGIGNGVFEFSSNWRAGEYTLTITEAKKLFPPVTRRLWVRPLGNDQQKTEPKKEALPAKASTVAVEFFPEGGELLAEVENRVYIRVRSNIGPADLQGIIVDRNGQEVARVQTAGLEDPFAPGRGLGSFIFRPQAGDSYQLRGRSPLGVEVSAPLPPVQRDGVALTLPAVICRPGEPIQISLQQVAPERQVIVALFCQGRPVASEVVAAKTGSTQVRLRPAVACSGVLRITIFEERAGQLWPLAERLAFRRPERRLTLSLKTDKPRYVPGDRVQLAIENSDEMGKSQAAWFLVTAVDETALAGRTKLAGADVPTYFQLTSELRRGEDLEAADIVLGDSPAAERALDLFLGTQGWRRFIEAEQQGILLPGKTAATSRAEDSLVPAIVKLDNLQQVAPNYTAEMNQASTELAAALTKRDQELVRAGSERLGAVRLAAQDLDAYNSRAGEILHLAMGFGAVLLFVAAFVLLAIGLVRLARGLASNRPYLVGSFAALFLCTLILWGPVSRLGSAGSPADLSKADSYAHGFEKALDFPLLALKSDAQGAPSRLVSQARWGSSGEDKLLVTTGPEQAVPAKRPESRGRPLLGSIKIKPPATPSPAGVLPRTKASVPQLPIRAYAFDPAESGSGEPPNTILWQPVLFAEDGKVEVSFSLPAKAAAYRICVQGHDATGRLGAIQERLECQEKAIGAVK